MLKHVERNWYTIRQPERGLNTVQEVYRCPAGSYRNSSSPEIITMPAPGDYSIEDNPFSINLIARARDG